MTNPKNKEVRFDLYCETCKYLKTEEYEEPCNSCLENFFNEGTDKPVYYEED